jgi:hypothetical protein
MSKRGYKCQPKESKVRKWVASMRATLAKEQLSPGEASKLAGRLSWASSKLFKKLGRAMLRPIHDQKTRRDGRISHELRRALRWWVEVLEQGLCEKRAWRCVDGEPVQLFCDASGYPAHLGAVLLLEGRCCFTHYVPPQELMAKFKSRKDNQIMGLELLSISLGLSTFAELLRGRKVVIHSDNTGSEVCLHCAESSGTMFARRFAQAAIRRGTAVEMDHAQIVHEQWAHAAQLAIGVHVLRVGTHDNIADLPSRDVRHPAAGLHSGYCRH